MLRLSPSPSHVSIRTPDMGGQTQDLKHEVKLHRDWKDSSAVLLQSVFMSSPSINPVTLANRWA